MAKSLQGIGTGGNGMTALVSQWDVMGQGGGQIKKAKLLETKEWFQHHMRSEAAHRIREHQLLLTVCMQLPHQG